MKNYFSRSEKLLWSCSALMIAAAWAVFDRADWLRLLSSLTGVTSLILAAKGHPLSQGLMIVFSLLYGAVSYRLAYYGEMLTYLGMTMPMAVFSLIAWLRNPFKGKRSQVEVGRLRPKDHRLMALLTAGVTAVCGYLLYRLDTPLLPVSILSVTTSFSAVYLTLRRSPLYAAAYAANDTVLMILWTAASIRDRAYISVTVCFAAFLVNDLYGFYSWRRMAVRQELERKN